MIPVEQPDSAAGWGIVDTSLANVNWDYPSAALISGRLTFVCVQDPQSNHQFYLGQALNYDPVGPADFGCYNLTQAFSLDRPNLVAVGGRPCVAHTNPGAYELHIMQATVPQPAASDWGEYTLDTYGGQPYLGLLDGKPAVLYTTEQKAFAWGLSEHPANGSRWLIIEPEELHWSSQQAITPWVTSGGLPLAVVTFYDGWTDTDQLYISMAQEK